MLLMELSDETFEQEVLNSEEPVLVDFWAPWCGPCRMVGPIVHSISEDFEGKLKVVKVNVDDCPQTANKYSIQSIPTLAVFQKGKIHNQQIGAVSRDVIEGMFKDVI